MPVSFKPEGYNIVSPYLIVDDAEKCIAFLKAVFAADEVQVFRMPSSAIMHAELLVGDTIIMVGNAGPNWPSVPAHVHVYVQNVDETYHQAIDNGGRSIQAPSRRGEEPDRRAGILGPGGITWWISTRVT